VAEKKIFAEVKSSGLKRLWPKYQNSNFKTEQFENYYYSWG